MAVFLATPFSSTDPCWTASDGRRWVLGSLTSLTSLLCFSSLNKVLTLEITISWVFISAKPSATRISQSLVPRAGDVTWVPRAGDVAWISQAGTVVTCLHISQPVSWLYFDGDEDKLKCAILLEPHKTCSIVA